MKTLRLLAMLMVSQLSLSPHLAAQPSEKSAEQAAFDKAYKLYDSDSLEQSWMAFYEFMNAYPESPNVARAHFNIAVLGFQLGYTFTATSEFKKILEQGYNEQDENTLMEPYALYKHNSCRYLAEIYLEQKDFDEAAKYIRMFEIEYPYQHFCGNEWAAYALYKSFMYARLYEGRNQTEKAVRELVPHIFSNGLASNQYVVEELVNLLQRHYSSQQIETELRNAIATLKVTQKKKRERATILLYGKEVEINEYFYEPVPIQKDLKGAEKYRELLTSNFLFTSFLPK